MTDKKDIWKSRYYLGLRTCMTITGLWPYSGLCERYTRFIPIFVFSSSILIPQLRYTLVASNINDIMESGTSVLISIVLSFKIANIMFVSKNVRSCLKSIEEDWRSLNTDVERSILERHTAYGQHLTTSYAIFIHITVGFYLFKPIILTFLEINTANSTSTLKFPYRVEYGMDVDQYFYLITLHCYLAVFAHIFSAIAVDSLYLTLIQHTCGMFSIIGYVLEEIGKNNNANFHLILNKTEDDDYKIALNCLRRHLNTIKFAKLIESTFTQLLLISVYLNVIMGSITGMQIVINLGKGINDVIGPLAMCIIELVHVFLQCWQAQYLLDYSFIPYESICRGNWYYTSKRCQKIFLLIMTRTIIPCRITAGKIMTLSIESFSVILKTMMSYFTMLRSFQ